MKIGFDNQKYLTIQSEHIIERIAQFGGKLYLEFGGKLFDDFHASRVLPGFEPDSKLKMLLQLKDQAEVVMAISATDIESEKIRGDYGITYKEDILRLKREFERLGLYVSSVVITRFAGQQSAKRYKERLENMGIPVYFLYNIEGYPANIDLTVSDEGYGRNDYIKTTRPLVVVTAPGPGSGKLAVCLSQVYNENKRGVKAGYAKFETFPVWNMPLQHPVNLAYEAATADLDDINMIDPFHMDAYGKTTVNYNRDIEAFPVLNTIFTHIYGESPYKSPTDMGVNMVGYCISDDAACRHASNMEIIRRFYSSLNKAAADESAKHEVVKIDSIMKKAGIVLTDRPVVKAAEEYTKQFEIPSAAIELDDGTVVTGKTSKLLDAPSYCLLRALKYLAGLSDQLDIMLPEVVQPMIDLQRENLNIRNPKLSTNEVLIALAISASTNEDCKKALEQLPKLRSCDLHSTVKLDANDTKALKKLGLLTTCNPTT